MEVFSKEELIEFLKPMHQKIADLEQRVSFLEEQLSEKVRTMKMPEVRKILGLSWDEVKTRIDRKIIPARRKGSHWTFLSSDIYHLSKNRDLLKL